MNQTDINRSAPALGMARTTIRASINDVWQCLTAFETWPDWNPQVSKMHLHGPVEVGTTFRWVAGGSRIVSRIEAIDPPHRLAWSGSALGIRAMHVWTFESQPEGTLVHTEESFDGFLPKLFPGLMRKMLAKTLDQTLAALKKHLETRPGTPAA